MFNFGVKIWILGKILIFKTHILPCRTPATYNTGIAKLTNIYSKCYKFSEALLTQFQFPEKCVEMWAPCVSVSFCLIVTLCDRFYPILSSFLSRF